MMKAKVRRNNKGFSLLEVVATLALLGLIAVTVSGFVVLSSNTYSRVNGDIALQYESQLMVGRLRENLIDINGGATFDRTNAKLYIIDREQDGTYNAFIYRLDKENGVLYYSTAPVEYDETIPGFVCTPESEHIVGNDVSAYSVSFEKTGEKQVAELTIKLANGGKTYTVTQKIGMRNDIVVANTFEELIERVCEE